MSLFQCQTVLQSDIGDQYATTKHRVYQELHVAQVLLPGWWHEPLLSFVVLGSQILQGFDAVNGSHAFVTLLSPVAAGTQTA